MNLTTHNTLLDLSVAKTCNETGSSSLSSKDKHTPNEEEPVLSSCLIWWRPQSEIAHVQDHKRTRFVKCLPQLSWRVRFGVWDLFPYENCVFMSRCVINLHTCDDDFQTVVNSTCQTVGIPHIYQETERSYITRDTPRSSWFSSSWPRILLTSNSEKLIHFQ